MRLDFIIACTTLNICIIQYLQWLGSSILNIQNIDHKLKKKKVHDKLSCDQHINVRLKEPIWFLNLIKSSILLASANN